MLKKIQPVEGLRRAGDLGWLLGARRSEILLFDYKTDLQGSKPIGRTLPGSTLILYAEALHYVLMAKKVEKYLLVLLGGPHLENGESGVNHGNCTEKHRTDPKGWKVI